MSGITVCRRANHQNGHTHAWHVPQPEFRGSAPILRLTLEDVSTIELEPHLTIERLTEPEIEDIRREYSSIPIGVGSNLGGAFWEVRSSLRTTYTMEGDYMDGAYLSGRLSQAETVLRLFEGGNLGIPFVELTQTTDDPRWSGIHRIGSWMPAVRPFGPTCVLSAGRAGSLQAFWRKVASLFSPDELQRSWFRIAISRFNSCYARILMEDRLIDLIVGLEALLAREADEIAFRLSNRGSIPLGESDDERTQILTVLKTAYKMRNKV